MPRVLILAAILAACLIAQPPGRNLGKFMPPEIRFDRYIDVLDVAPGVFGLETDSQQFRVLRAKLAGHANVPFHDQRPALIVAITSVQLRVTTPDKKYRDVLLNPGQTQWVERGSYTQQNLSGDPCEFLLIETAPPQA